MRGQATRYVTQDGADFYIFRDSAMKDLQTTWTAPIPVRFGDMAAAKAARERCQSQLEFADYRVVWPNPFDDGEY